MTLAFVTFANTSYMHPSRILEEAHEFGVFTSIQHKTEHDIQEFVNKHKSFIELHPQGYGYWIWKPKVILDSLLSLQADDILVYCDAGMKLNKLGLPRFHEYMEILQRPESHMVTFSMNESHVPQRYIKADAVAEYFPEFQDSSRYTRYCYAGVLMLKRTEKTIQLLKDWLSLCENYHYIDRSSSARDECPNFQGNDCDMGLLNLCLAKYSIHTVIFPDETNLYTPDGDQDVACTDWSSLNAYPFHYRRIRPRLSHSLEVFENRNDMIATLVPRHGVYAEIGVFNADFSDILARTLFPSKLVLIDLFTGMMGSGDQDGNNFRMIHLDSVYSRLMNVKHPALTVLKGDSVTMLQTFPDNTFDMIYIDADHSYEGSRRDILAAYPKIKHGGWLMGHDYEMNMKKAHQAYEFGVKRAVDEFCVYYGQTVRSKAMDGCVSFAIKIQKAL